MNVTKIIEHTRKWTWQIQSQVKPTQNTRMSTSKMITIKIFDLMATPSLMSFEPSKKFMLQLQHVIYPSKNFNWSPQWLKLKCEVSVSLEWESPAPYSNAACFLLTWLLPSQPDGLIWDSPAHRYAACTLLASYVNRTPSVVVWTCARIMTHKSGRLAI